MNSCFHAQRVCPTIAFAGLIAVCLCGCGSNETSQFEQLRKRQQQQELANLQREQTFEQQLENAREEFERGSPQRVLEITRPLLIRFPEQTDVIFLTAKAQAALGEKQAAAELLESIAGDDPRDGKRAAMQAVTWLTDAGQLEQAIDRLTIYLKLDPDSDRARHRLVELLNNSGRRIEAAEQLQFLLRRGDVSEKELFSMITLGDAFIDESIPPPRFDKPTPTALAQARKLRDRGDLVEALSLVESLRTHFPDSTPSAAFLGKVLAELNQFDRLAAWSQTLPTGIDVEPEYWHALGKLSLHQQEFRAAVRCFGETLELDPTERGAVLELARALKFCDETRNAELAIQQFHRLEETEALAKMFGKAAGTAQQYRRMAVLLDELNRPWEAIAWDSIAIAKNAGVEKDWQALENRRLELQRRDTSTTFNAGLDGFDLSQWPLPSTNIGSLGSRVQDRNTPSTPSTPSPPIRLDDVAQSAGLRFQYANGDDLNDEQFFLHQQTGGGIGVIDMDLDGWPDLYFTQAGGEAMDASASKPNQLFRNAEGERFDTVTLESGTGDTGYGQGVAVADINQDGFPDLVVANIGNNVLMINNGDGTFEHRPLPAEGDGRWTTSIACGDLNGDHLPDIVEVNYIDDESAFQIACVPHNDACGPSRFRPASDRWLSVDAEGHVRHLQVPPAIDESPSGHGFSVIIANMDDQVGNDVYIANDGDANLYWQSRFETDKTWKPTETAYLSGCATCQRGGRHGSMGLTYGDFDRNGQLDLHVTNYWDQEADLYLQQSGGIFQHASRAWQLREASKPTVGWGTQAADLNRDGWLDLVVLNGHIVDHSQRGIPFRMLPQLFQGQPDHFQLVTDPAGAESFWSQRTLGRTLAVLDWNRDGRPDLVANHLDQPVTLLENHSNIENWAQFQFVGTTSERDAIGTIVKLTAGENHWSGWVVGGGGFLCSNEAVVDFGIAQNQQITELQIQWPSGLEQTLHDLPANQRYLCVEGQPQVIIR